MPPKFGPAGNSESFYEQGHKSSLEMPAWLKDMGLDAYEYSLSRGINIKEDTAIKLGEKAKAYNIHLSIHAPYYINLASQDAEKLNNSINYIINSVKAAIWMGAKRVVFHPGSCSNMDRKFALNCAIDALKSTLFIIKEMKCEDVIICPETMGKRNQLGTLDEVLELCRLNEGLTPTIDFGHINALGQGSLKSKEDFEAVLIKTKNSLGEYRLKNLHCHFSRIEFTNNGEKKHWTYKDVQYGPDFPPLAELLVKYHMNPVIICESRGTMAEDALEMKNIYQSFLK
ncbi:putative endonuclease 4 [Oxobacter pfennigii]|uniref:Putative endonuclease 4 n=1 Tax=Oxobacter pfennigii TaxID=36849 RepID=A0A0P8WB37_9CLOT|nr:TIM barrel protein [Oxobacter pfennigii]KPU44927.1 putative endonuclease 4 [Oxobacter pfennigii]